MILDSKLIHLNPDDYEDRIADLELEITLLRNEIARLRQSLYMVSHLCQQAIQQTDEP